MLRIKYIVLALLAVSLFLAAPATTAAQGLIYPATWDETELSGQQLARYNKAVSYFGTSGIIKIGIGDLAALPENRIELSLPTSHCEGIAFKGKQAEYVSENDYTWYGELAFDSVADSCACRSGYLLLMSKGGEKYGQIKLEDEFYTIEDIGGKQLLARHPEGEQAVSCNGTLMPEEEEDDDLGLDIEARSSGNCQVNVLVLYTTAAGEVTVNIENVAASSVAITNQALLNSSVFQAQLRLNLVAVEEISDIDEEDLQFLTILTRLRNSNFARSRRNFHNADIVILLVDHWRAAEGGGIAYLGPNREFAYAVVQSIGANAQFTFSHEVGHLLGARHEPCAAQDAGDNCDDNGIYEHAHTWSWTTGCLFWKRKHKRKTIMYSGGKPVSPGEVIQNYSNPNVRREGRPTGISEERDNARLLRENGCTVANFRGGSEGIIANIVGLGEICPEGFTCLNSSISGAPGPYTHEWRMNGSGTDWGNAPVVGTGTTFCAVMPYGSFGVGDILFVRLEVTAANGAAAYAYHSLEVVEGNDGNVLCMRSSGKEETPSDATYLEVNPNPVTDVITVRFSIAAQSEVSINIYDAVGRPVRRISKGLLLPGEYQEPLALSPLSSGTYCLELLGADWAKRLLLIKI